MNWWGYTLLAALCWGMQYVLLEALSSKVNFASAFTFLSLANGLLITIAMLAAYPSQNWAEMWKSWPILGLVVLYLIFGGAALFFNTYSIWIKNATLVAVLEITYPVFIMLFTAVFLRKVHLNPVGLVGAFFVLIGAILVVYSAKNCADQQLDAAQPQGMEQVTLEPRAEDRMSEAPRQEVVTGSMDRDCKIRDSTDSFDPPSK